MEVELGGWAERLEVWYIGRYYLETGTMYRFQKKEEDGYILVSFSSLFSVLSSPFRHLFCCIMLSSPSRIKNHLNV